MCLLRCTFFLDIGDHTISFDESLWLSELWSQRGRCKVRCNSGWCNKQFWVNSETLSQKQFLERSETCQKQF